MDRPGVDRVRFGVCLPISVSHISLSFSVLLYLCLSICVSICPSACAYGFFLSVCVREDMYGLICLKPPSPPPALSSPFPLTPTLTCRHICPKCGNVTLFSMFVALYRFGNGRLLLYPYVGFWILFFCFIPVCSPCGYE